MSGALRWFEKTDKLNLNQNSVQQNAGGMGNSAPDRPPAKTPAEPVVEEEISADVVALHDTTSAPDYPELDKWYGKFKGLASSPYEGSVLRFIQDHRIGKKEIIHYMENTYLKRVGLIVFDPDTDWAAYSLYSLVVPHQTAVNIAEDIVKAAKSRKTDKIGESEAGWKLLSEMTGYDMRDRGDLGNAIRAVLRRYPKFIDIFLSITKMR